MSRTHRYRDRGPDGHLLAKYRYRRPDVRWPRGTPRWWRKLYMTRPRRRENRLLCHQLARGADPDAMVFPVGNRKPHFYYW